MNIVLLVVSVLLATIRNVLSKGISDLTFGTKRFFFAQAMIFLTGGVLLGFVSGKSLLDIAGVTVLYAVLYAVMLLAAQYCYTAALKKGNVGICSAIYALGFVFPTMSGFCFWNEPLTAWDVLGILTVIPAVVISGIRTKSEKKAEGVGYIIPLVGAMLSSGGLGILQKLQQKTPYQNQMGVFLMLAFFLAGVVSLLLSVFVTSGQKIRWDKKVGYAAGIGCAFCICNICNTILAGRLPSAVFFPIYNIGTIFFSTITGILLFRERLRIKDALVFLLGGLAIVFITVL